MSETVFINGRFLSQRLTGVQRYAHETLRALDELLSSGQVTADYRLEVIAPPDAEQPALSRIGFRRVGKLSGNAWEQVSLPRETRGGLLLSFGPTGPLFKGSQIVTIHDASVHAVPAAFSWRFRTWYKLLLPVLVRRAPLVVTVSRFSRDEVSRYFGAEVARLRVSDEGWQHVTRTPADRSVCAAHGLTKGRYVLAVGSMTPHKNFAVVARAAALLTDAPLDVVVAGAVNAKVFGRHRPDATSRMKLVGYVTDGQLRALYEHAAAFVYPSLYEGFGIPPLEAMALGCPVIAARAAAIPEVCGDAALYFDPHAPDELAALMRRLAAHPDERAALVARGYAQLGRHSWEASARCQVAVLEEARRRLRARRARPRLMPRASAVHALASRSRSS